MICSSITWNKIGKVFDPHEHQLPANCTEYAQSPQVLVFDDYVRVYFSTRQRDSDGKFLSHVAYADFDDDFRNVLRVSCKPVISLGKLGTFDQHGIFPFNVLRVDDKVYAYTCGWSRRVGVSVETGIGLAISDDDGETFERLGDGPILSASLNEPCLVGDGFVVKVGDAFHMWYIFGLPWRTYSGQSTPDRIYKIAHATSNDGVRWSKSGGSQLIPDVLGEDECQALPTVVQHDGRFHMYFCYRYASDFRTNPARAYRLGYAYSDDFIHWTRDDEQVGIRRGDSQSDWDCEMMCYPHVFWHRNRLSLLYNGNEFGRCGFGLAIAQDETS